MKDSGRSEKALRKPIYDSRGRELGKSVSGVMRTLFIWR